MLNKAERDYYFKLISVFKKQKCHLCRRGSNFDRYAELEVITDLYTIT